jgi:hypothetical protein
MNLVATIEKLQNKPLTPSEAATIRDFQTTFSVEDDDPLIVVLALMARSQLILESVPNLLQQKVNETIELHQTLLRTQAVAIAKDLIKELTPHITLANKNWVSQVSWYIGFFVGGIVFSFGCTWLVKHPFW